MFERLGSLRDTVMEYASFLADERISELAVDARQHPEEYPSYHQACGEVVTAEQAIRAELNEHQQKLLTALIELISVRDGIEYCHVYELGVMDGGRIHHALVTHELPHQLTDGKGGTV